MGLRRKGTKPFICIKCGLRTLRNVPSNTEWSCNACGGNLLLEKSVLEVKQDKKAKEQFREMGI